MTVADAPSRPLLAHVAWAIATLERELIAAARLGHRGSYGERASMLRDWVHQWGADLADGRGFYTEVDPATRRRLARVLSHEVEPFVPIRPPDPPPPPPLEQRLARLEARLLRLEEASHGRCG